MEQLAVMVYSVAIIILKLFMMEAIYDNILVSQFGCPELTMWKVWLLLSMLGCILLPRIKANTEDTSGNLAYGFCTLVFSYIAYTLYL